MRNIYSKYQLIIPFLLIFTAGFAQYKNTINSIIEVNHQVPNSFQRINLFSEEKANLSLNTKIKNDGLENKATLLSINETELNLLLQKPKKTLAFTIPNGTNITEVELFRVEIFDPSFNQKIDSLNRIDGSETIHKMIHYQGVIRGSKNSLVAVSISDNGISGMISDSLGNMTLGKVNGSNTYIYYNSNLIDGKIQLGSCGTPDPSTFVLPPISSTPNEYVKICKVVRVFLYIDYDYYAARGQNISSVIDNIGRIFNIVAAIYRQEGIAIQLLPFLNEIATSPSGYTYETNASTLLDNFTDNTGNNFPGEMYILIVSRQMSVQSNGSFTAGIAYRDNICTDRTKAKGVVRLSTTDAIYPSFSSSANTWAHEMGHILGSPHTHWCGWPGGPIDDCAPVENDNGGPGSCSPGPHPPANGGTIMSYCHNSVGVNFSLGFGINPTHPGDVIRQRVYYRDCYPVAITLNPPTDLQSTNITNNSVILEWLDPIQTNSNYYIIQIRKIGELTWQNKSSQYSLTNFQINNLDINTNYEWRVKTECSEWAYGAFKTLPTFGDISTPKYVFCAGDNATINFPIQGSQYLFLRSFVIELSDANGSFASPTQIGFELNYPSTGDMNIQIPSNIPMGKKYRIRIRMTNPEFIIDKASDISVGIDPPILQTFTTCPDSYTQVVKSSDPTIGGNKEDELRKIVPTNDGGKLLFGSSKSEKNNSTEKRDVNKGNYDYWLVKIDANNIYVWDKTFGGDDADLGSNIIPTSDGGYLLGGSSYSGKSGDKSQGNIGGANGTMDYWVVKISSNGNMDWNRRFGGVLNDELSSMIQKSNGNYLLAGRSNSPTDGDKTQPPIGGSYDYWIVEISPDGDYLHDYVYGGGDDESSPTITSLPDGGYLLAGSSLSNATGNKTENSRGSWDYWLVKINENMVKVWDKSYGGGGEDKLANIALASDGNFVLAGSSDSNITGDKSEPSWNNSRDFWTLKINSQDRSIIKQHRFGGGGDDGCNALLATPDGGFLLAGSSNSNLTGDKSEASRGDTYDYWMVKVDGNLEMKWNKRYGGGDQDYGMALAQNNDGSYTLGGISSSNATGDKSEDSRGLTDYWTVVFRDCQTSSSTTVNVGQKTFLSANGCLGTIAWSNGATTNNIIVSPTTNSTYTATCYYGCSSNVSSVLTITVDPCPTTYKLTSPNDDYINSPIILKAKATNGSLNAKNKITGTSNVLYEGKNITLNAGFEAKQGSIFKAQVGGCN